MKIHEDDFGLFAELFNHRRDDEEWIFQRGHEGAALDVEDCDWRQ